MLGENCEMQLLKAMGIEQKQVHAHCLY